MNESIHPSRHEEYSAVINASAERVFDLLDDQTRLTEHMSKRSWKMGWGRMETALDAQQGRSVGYTSSFVAESSGFDSILTRS